VPIRPQHPPSSSKAASPPHFSSCAASATGPAPAAITLPVKQAAHQTARRPAHYQSLSCVPSKCVCVWCTLCLTSLHVPATACLGVHSAEPEASCGCNEWQPTTHYTLRSAAKKSPHLLCQGSAATRVGPVAAPGAQTAAAGTTLAAGLGRLGHLLHSHCCCCCCRRVCCPQCCRCCRCCAGPLPGPRVPHWSSDPAGKQSNNDELCSLCAAPASIQPLF
jgi:hypothetical protein